MAKKESKPTGQQTDPNHTQPRTPSPDHLMAESDACGLEGPTNPHFQSSPPSEAKQEANNIDAQLELERKATQGRPRDATRIESAPELPMAPSRGGATRVERGPEPPTAPTTGGATRVEGLADREAPKAAGRHDATRVEAPPSRGPKQKPGAGSQQQVNAPKVRRAATSGAPEGTRSERSPAATSGSTPSANATRITSPEDRTLREGARPEMTLRSKEAPTVILEVTKGDQPGTRFELGAGAHVIGRSREADIVLFDVGVSRMHARILVSLTGVELEDLHSGNGTKLNDQPVILEQLQPGDEISLGDHRLHVSIQGDAQLPARRLDAGQAVPSLKSLQAMRSKKRSGRGVLYLSVGAGVLVLLLAVLLVPRPKSRDPFARVAAERAKAATIFKDGIQLFKAQKYPQARAEFEAALKLYPAHDGSKRYLKAVEREQRATHDLASADVLYRGGSLDEARRMLERIPAESLQRPKAMALLQEIRKGHFAAARERFEGALARADPAIALDHPSVTPEGDSPLALEEARLASLQTLDLATARAVLEALATTQAGLPEPDPAFEAMRQRLEDRKQGIAEALQLTQAKIDTLKQGLKLNRAEAVAEAIKHALAPVRAALDRGDFKQALSAAKRALPAGEDLVEARRALKRARRAIPVYERGVKKAAKQEQDNRSSAAAAAWGQAYRAAKIIENRGKALKDARTGVVRNRYRAGQSAFNAERWGDAFREWRAGAKVAPSDSNLKRGLGDLGRKAHQIFMQAYVNKGPVPDRARRGFKLVLTMTPTDSKLAEKARKNLSDLGG